MTRMGGLSFNPDSEFESSFTMESCECASDSDGIGPSQSTAVSSCSAFPLEERDGNILFQFRFFLYNEQFLQPQVRLLLVSLRP